MNTRREVRIFEALKCCVLAVNCGWLEEACYGARWQMILESKSIGISGGGDRLLLRINPDGIITLYLAG